LQEGRRLTETLLILALFPVFVVMAIQCESRRKPFIILLSVPSALVVVAPGIGPADPPMAMPVNLGMIMLAGIVVTPRFRTGRLYRNHARAHQRYPPRNRARLAQHRSDVCGCARRIKGAGGA